MSHGISAQSLTEIWQQGPQAISLPEYEWPTVPPLNPYKTDKTVKRDDRRLAKGKVERICSRKKLNGSSLHLQRRTKMVAQKQLLKSCKLAIKKAIGNNKIKSFEIDSCFLEIANVINQRPIGRVSTDPSEGTYLVLMTFCLDVHPLKYPKDYLERLETHENTLSLYREYWMIFRNTGKERSSQHWFLVESGMQTEHYQKYGILAGYSILAAAYMSNIFKQTLVGSLHV